MQFNGAIGNIRFYYTNIMQFNVIISADDRPFGYKRDVYMDIRVPSRSVETGNNTKYDTNADIIGLYVGYNHFINYIRYPINTLVTHHNSEMPSLMFKNPISNLSVGCEGKDKSIDLSGIPGLPCIVGLRFTECHILTSSIPCIINNLRYFYLSRCNISTEVVYSIPRMKNIVCLSIHETKMCEVDCALLSNLRLRALRIDTRFFVNFHKLPRTLEYLHIDCKFHRLPMRQLMHLKLTRLKISNLEYNDIIKLLDLLNISVLKRVTLTDVSLNMCNDTLQSKYPGIQFDSLHDDIVFRSTI